MAVSGAQWRGRPAPQEERAEILARARPVPGANPPPPGTRELPLGRPQQLWVGIHLADAAALERVAASCEQFTSLVSVEPPDEVVLEVQGSLRLFGGIDALLARLTDRLREQTIEARLAAMPTPGSALWAARASRHCTLLAGVAVPVIGRLEELPQYLSEIPLVCLRWPEEKTELLENLGVRSVGDLMRLPRDGLARRLGRPWLTALDRALGRSAEPRRSFRAAQRYTDAFEPETPLDTTDRLEAYLLARLEGLQRFLRERQAAIGVLGIRLLHRGHPATQLRIATASPCAEVERFRSLLRERLSQLRLPEPVQAVRLKSGVLALHEGHSGSLLHKMDPELAGEEGALARLVEKLQARLADRTALLFGVRLAADHRPEKAWQAVAALSSEKGAAPSSSWFVRPIWLCTSPQLLPPSAPRNWIFECGPERIETGWWDAEEAVRDYFIVREQRGARLWVYRERRPPHAWYLHGLFG